MSSAAASEQLDNERDLKEGNAWIVRAMKAARMGLTTGAPDRLKWSKQDGGQNWKPQPLSETSRRAAERAAILSMEKEQAIARAVHRDPCPKCGVRGDIGCRHK